MCRKIVRVSERSLNLLRKNLTRETPTEKAKNHVTNQQKWASKSMSKYRLLEMKNFYGVSHDLFKSINIFQFFGQMVKNPVVLQKSDLSEKNLFSAKISENFISDFSSEKFIFKLKWSNLVSKNDRYLYNRMFPKNVKMTFPRSSRHMYFWRYYN